MKLLGAVALALLMLLPATVSAGSQPAVYYLRDGELGPATDGELNATVPNATQPSVRVIPVAATAVMPVRFAASDLEHPERLLGPVYAAVWLGPSPVAKGNLTVTLMAMNGSIARPLLNASFPLDVNASNLPNPTAMAPPTPAVPPSDPQGYATYLAYYVLGQVIPAVQPPPRLFLLGMLDEEIGPDEMIALDFTITQGSSTLPAAQGLFGSVQYDGASTPSFVYVPWYSPSPQVTSTWTPTPPRTSQPPSSNIAPSPSESDVDVGGGKGVPGPEFIVLAMAIGAAAIVRRRKA
jgi:hypothetical protein